MKTLSASRGIRIHASSQQIGDTGLLADATAALHLRERRLGRCAHVGRLSRVIVAFQFLVPIVVSGLIIGAVIAGRAAADPWAPSLAGRVSVGGHTASLDHLYMTAVTADGMDDATRRAGLQLMERAKIDARAAALACVGLPPDAGTRVRIRTGAIEGPSAGLMFALAIVQQLEGGDVTRGRRVAGTGAIDAAGHVLQVGFVAEKAAAAQDAGADTFLVPASEVDLAHDAPGRIRVVGVSDLDGALRALQGHGCARANR